ncbi:MAG: ATP-binding protein [Proteobacteria bacterium]|nr:ATP-binding protein [Pseudomonadota bacterium]
MESLIEQLILDFQERDLPGLTPRTARLPVIPGKIDSVIGMRRSGKTYFLYQKIQALLRDGVPKECILHINFDDERLYPMVVGNLGKITDTYYRLYPHLKDRKCYVFFDEVQNVEGWERYVRRILDTENVQITLTGSSSKLLSREIATSLRGRSISTEIFPFSFIEAMRHQDMEDLLVKKPGAKKRAMLENRFLHYLKTGGFPELQQAEDTHRLRILRDYVDVVILRDIVERHRLGNVLPLRILVRALLSQPAGLFSVNKFYNDIKSQGVTCSKTSLHEYLDHLTESYLIYPVSIHSRSERVRRVNPKKVYSVDTGLSQTFLHEPTIDMGKLLESFVFMQFRRQGMVIEYYRTSKGYEVDFLTSAVNNESTLTQVSVSLQSSQTRERELRTLFLAMDELNLDKATIVTLNETERIKTGNKHIDILPAWKWALTFP